MFLRPTGIAPTTQHLSNSHSYLIVCVYRHTYVHMYGYTKSPTHIFCWGLYICTYMYMRRRIYIYIYICFRLCMNKGYRFKTVMKHNRYVFIFTLICMYIYVHACSHACTYSRACLFLYGTPNTDFVPVDLPLYCFECRLQYRYFCAPVRFMFLVVVGCDEEPQYNDSFSSYKQYK